MDAAANLTEQELLELLMDSYKNSPALYAHQVLGKKLWKKQIQITQAILRHKKVFVQASHAVGKSFVAASLVNWHFDCFNPSITMTTAPNRQQVIDVLWKEIRLQRGGRGGETFLLPKEPRMETDAAHFAMGLTAKDGDAMQGRHEENIGIIFDEAVGIESQFFEAAEGMMTNANEGAWWLCICNPTDPTSRAYQETQNDEFYVMLISAMEHPNVLAALRGEPLPYPKAVGINYIDGMVRKYCEEIDPRDRRSGDIFWALPDRNGRRNQDNPQCYRPGPMMESRVLGRWPSNTTSSIWSDAMWRAAVRDPSDVEESGYAAPLDDSEFMDKMAQIGCDVAWSGSDYTTIVGRRGKAALSWETHNGWRPPQIAQGLKQTALNLVEQRNKKYRHLSNFVGEDPKRILIVVDHDATGNALLDYMGGYNIVTQSGMSPSLEEDAYPNRRSENWFVVANMADMGNLDLSRLPSEAHKKLRAQAMSPTWTIDGAGRRVVEEKVKTRRRLKRSPDDMDALNLAYAQPSSVIFRMPVSVGGNGKIVALGAGPIQNAGTRMTDAVRAVKGSPNAHNNSMPGIILDTNKLTGDYAEHHAKAVLGGKANGKPKRRLM